MISRLPCILETKGRGQYLFRNKPLSYLLWISLVPVTKPVPTHPTIQVQTLQVRRSNNDKQREIENRRQSMTVLVAWASLSVGIVMGAMWRSLCEKQSRSNTDIGDGSVNLYRLTSESPEWNRQPDTARRRSA